MSSLAGKRCLVTGAGKGIGRDVCIHLASLGVHVVALSRTQADLDSLKAEIPTVITIQADVANDDDVSRAIEAAGEVCGKRNLLISRLIREDRSAC